MSSSLFRIPYLHCFTPTNPYDVDQSRTSYLKISTITQLTFPNVKRSKHMLFQGMNDDRFSSFSQRCCIVEAAVKCYGLGSSGTIEDSNVIREDEKNDFQNEAENSKNDKATDDETDRESGSGEGNDNGSGKGNGNGNSNGNNCPEEGPKFNHERLTGLEWWWWWKWQQTRQTNSSNDIEHNLWPVKHAVKVVANGVKETIEPAVRAIVLCPITKLVTSQGLLLCLVFGAIFVSCVQLFAGLAMISTGVSLAGLACIVLGILWRTSKQHSSTDQRGHDNNYEL